QQVHLHLVEDAAVAGPRQPPQQQKQLQPRLGPAAAVQGQRQERQRRFTEGLQDVGGAGALRPTATQGPEQPADESDEGLGVGDAGPAPRGGLLYFGVVGSQCPELLAEPRPRGGVLRLRHLHAGQRRAAGRRQKWWGGGIQRATQQHFL